MQITPEQIRASRAILNLSQGALAAAAGVSRNTISHIETVGVTPAAKRTAEALSDMGIELVPGGARLATDV